MIAVRIAPLPLRLVFVLLCWLALPAWAADVRVTLPLEGLFRPGSYMPVRVEVREADESAPLRLFTEGAVPTEVAISNRRADGIVPMLMLEGGARQLRWAIGEQSGAAELPLRALGAGQRLVGGASTADPTLGGRLFPEAEVIAVRIDAADLLRAEPGAWQALDALVVGADLLMLDRVEHFAAAGVAIVIDSDDVPQTANALRWEVLDGHRVLRPGLLGPRRAGVLPAAFAPVQGWRAEMPGALRMRLLLYGLLLAIVLLGAALVRGRLGVAMFVVAALLATWWLHRWWHGTSPLLNRVGGVLVLSDGGAGQYDAWTYQSAGTRVAGQQPWVLPITWPFLEQERDRQMADLRLECAHDGRPLRFLYNMWPGGRIAFLTRSISVNLPSNGPAPIPGSSPMDRLAQRLYVSPGYTIGGVLPAAPDETADLRTERFPVTVIRRETAAQ